MKTKFLKFGMPFMVFTLAIVFAFATENSDKVDDTLLITGYVLQDGFCVESPKDCSNSGTYPCEDSAGRRVHLIKASDTSCSTAMWNWAP